ncbi:MAG TPA: hypothetical protein VF719_07485 [Abditibacteriaceae bacterium]
MRSLEDWIIKLVDEDIDKINRKYLSVSDGTIEKELESLPDIGPMVYGTSHVHANILGKLHLKIRSQKCETKIWDAIISRISGPLPTSAAHDLIDRDIIVDQLGHTRQDDEVQWRLGSLVDEALLTLVWDFFTNPIYEVAELQKLLSQHPNHLWLLDKWEHWALLSSSVREPEKEIVFHRWAWEHPKRPVHFPNTEQYLDIMAAKERQKIEEQARVEREENEEQLRIESETNARRCELERIANEMLDETKIQSILSSQDPDLILALANNSSIEVQWVHKLVNCHNVKGARQIREAADSNIKSRQQQHN